MLVQTVTRTLRCRGLLDRGRHILVGVSGGADSVALLAVLRELAPAWDLRLTVAHLNHGLRGRESDADAAFVRGLARRWGLPAVVGRPPRALRASRRGQSLEMAARAARYAFFARTARRLRCGCAATAHTADDQAETVLLNLARGAGAAGLSGIPYVGRHGGIQIIRPLRDVRRRDVERFLRKRGLAWREDASNADPAFLRNRVRHELLPFLEARFNPDIRKALWRLAEIMAGDKDWLDELAGRAYAGCRCGLAPGAAAGRGRRARPAAALNAAKVAALPLGARRRVIRRWLEAGGVTGGRIGFETVERVDDLAAGRRLRRTVELGGGWKASRADDRLVLMAPDKVPGGPAQRKEMSCNPRAVDGVVPVLVPGRTLLPGRRLRIEAAIGPGIVRERPRPVGVWPARASLSLKAWRRRRLVARAWEPGDRMRPLGLGGSKKVQDLFTDKKVPPDWRRRLPLIVCGGDIAWIPGFRIAEGWQVQPGERQALQLAVMVAPGKGKIFRKS